MSPPPRAFFIPFLPSPSPQYLLQCVEHIIDDETPATAAGVGCLTALDRDAWAGHRKRLEELDDVNRDNLRLLDTAVVCVCLDQWIHSDRRLGHTMANTLLAPDPANRCRH